MAELKQVAEWSRDKPPLVVAFALSLMPYVDFLDQWLDVLVVGNAVDYVGDVPPLSEWRIFYDRDHSALVSFLNKRLPQLSPPLSNVELFDQFLDSLDRLTGDDVDRFFEASPDTPGVWPGLVNRYAAYVRQNLTAIMDNLILRPLPAGAEPWPADAQFLMRVVVPHWILCGRSLYDSLDAARAGDLDALDVLLRLDPSLAHDVHVAEHIHRARHNSGNALSDRVTVAMKAPPVKPTRAKLKKLAFGFLSTISDRAGIRLETRDLRDLADLFVSIRSAGRDRCDTDLPDTLEALTKAIQRGRKELTELIKVGMPMPRIGKSRVQPDATSN